MKNLIIAIAFLSVVQINAQSKDSEVVKSTIIQFFEAFHAQDSSALRALASDKIVLQSISTNKEGKTQLNQSEYSDFLKSIASIPSTSTFEEKLLSFNIQVDGNMANAWTPYEFWFNGNFSHCGVNSFQLIKEEGTWKILYLVDTRRREGCK
ncbi:MAG: nuclear transport factor 2 family protein [Winogradskyella sp.]|nr:nuclear transport factor 2 family protein [Winogradskyella sp.]